MPAEVIAIGDELTSGQRLDTNSAWLSQRLGEQGIRVLYHTTVGDDLQANAEVFRTAIERADVIVATGGLGPTADDLTREALALATGTLLVRDDTALDHIRALFARRGREMPQRNVAQAMFPEGSRPIDNPHGTAPGIAFEIAREGGSPAHVFCLPGVPAEMRQMWTETVAPELARRGLVGRIIVHRRIKCFGAGESDLEAMLPDLIRRGRQPTVGITVHEATITLRVSAEGSSEAECLTSMQPTIETIRQCLGTLVFGAEDDELQDSVVRLLAERRQTLATSEWGTGGLIAGWLGDVPDNERVYQGGLVVAGEAALGALGELAAEDVSSPGDPLGEAVARNMARHVRERFAADYGLAVGGFPVTGHVQSNPPPFYLALATPRDTKVRAASLAGHPAIVKPRAAKQALNLLRLALIHGDKTR